MTNLNRELASMTKKERKEFQREIARIEREQERKRRKRRKITTIAVTAVAILAVLALIGWAILSAVRSANRGPENMLSDGIVLTGDGSAIAATATEPLEWGAQPVATEEGMGENQVNLRLYVDYSDADAAAFNAANLEQMQQWVTAGYASLEVHPIALGGEGYALRAANAAACVASLAPDSFLTVHGALLAEQADATDDSPSNAELATLVSDAGVTIEGVDECVEDGRFEGWVTGATERATSGALPDSEATLESGSLLLVNGEEYTGPIDDPASVIAFITQVLESASGEGTEGEGTEGEGTEGEGTGGTESPAPFETPTPTPAG
jgi:protein-disulfide isomerase